MNPNLTLALFITGIASILVILLFLGIRHGARKARERREEFERDVARARREMEERREQERKALAESQDRRREILGLPPRAGAAAGIAGGLASTNGVPRKPGMSRALGAGYGHSDNHDASSAAFFAQMAASHATPIHLPEDDEPKRARGHYADPVVESSAHDHTVHDSDPGTPDSGGGDCSCSD